jgi:hypothetical protein
MKHFDATPTLFFGIFWQRFSTFQPFLFPSFCIDSFDHVFFYEVGISVYVFAINVMTEAAV